MQQITLIWEIIIFGGIAAGAVAVSLATAGKQQKKMSRTDIRFKNMLDGKIPLPEKRMQRLKFTYWLQDVGRILRTFKIKKNVEVTDNGKIII